VCVLQGVLVTEFCCCGSFLVNGQVYSDFCAVFFENIIADRVALLLD